jgi:hypothetical protein
MTGAGDRVEDQGRQGYRGQVVGLQRDLIAVTAQCAGGRPGPCGVVDENVDAVGGGANVLGELGHAGQVTVIAVQVGQLGSGLHRRLEQVRQAGYLPGGLRAVDNQPGRLARQG